MECCVCLQETTSTLSPCEHPVCPSCAASWFARKVSCPMCRQSPSGMTTPPPSTVCSHTVVSVGDTAVVKYIDLDKLCIHFTDGITMQIMPRRPRGKHARMYVFSERLRWGRFRARCYISCGDLILDVNGVPLVDPASIIRLCYNASKVQRQLVFTVKRGDLGERLHTLSSLQHGR